jgi:long-subunit acyl-CoA synthetase (AMP-forming)
MKIKCYGHSAFRLTMTDGVRMIIDPYEPGGLGGVIRNTSAHNVSFCERSTSTDRALCFLPFNHVFGQMHIMNATIRSAGCLELLSSFDMNRFLAVTEPGQVTKLFSVPTVYGKAQMGAESHTGGQQCILWAA